MWGAAKADWGRAKLLSLRSPWHCLWGRLSWLHGLMPPQVQACLTQLWVFLLLHMCPQPAGSQRDSPKRTNETVTPPVSGFFSRRLEGQEGSWREMGRKGREANSGPVFRFWFCYQESTQKEPTFSQQP